MIPTKICGITNLEDARLAVDLGASAIGFIFYPPSPRFIEPSEAKVIIQSVGDRVCTVGVFVNNDVETINWISREVGLDMVQLSGDEAPEDLRGITLPIIKTLHVDGEFDVAVAVNYPAHAVLLDSKLPGRYGGTGQTWSWDGVELAQISKPVVLSGGLNPDNVSKAIKCTAPSAIDISSGVETAPGKKSPAKLRALFKILADHEGTNEQPFK